MPGSILARHRADLLLDTIAMTAAQQSALDAALAANPAARANPKAAVEIAASFGFTPTLPRPSPGAELLRRAKG